MNQGATEAGVDVGEAIANARRLLQNHPEAAADQARAVIAAEPEISEPYFILATALRRTDRASEAEAAERDGLTASLADPVLAEVRRIIGTGEPHKAQWLLERFLQDTPNDPEALRLLADLAKRAGRLQRAEQMLRLSLGLAPRFEQARGELHDLIGAQAAAYSGNAGKPPAPPEGTAEFQEALNLNRQMVAEGPFDPAAWLSLGHASRIAGNQADSVESYRKAVSLKPDFGEAWWSLADLKTVRLDASDREAMAAQLERADVSAQDRIGLTFALAKAFDDEGRHEEAFRLYSEANAQRHRLDRLAIEPVEAYVQASNQLFTADFFAAREEYGRADPDPIFIVGMPRSGSTLVEQILSSHGSVEGTEELVYFGNLANLLADGRRAAFEPSPFLEKVAALTNEEATRIGGAYLWNAERNRRSSRPRFIDKMPRNWLYLPLIRLALPKAKIVDVRRDPVDCCWSNFRQLFADSGEFSYDLAEIGRFYDSYRRFMDHFDEALPGAVHRLRYEELVASPESTVRSLLDYLGLPFEEACLRFDRNPRAVKTSSSEQVRQPISAGAVGQAAAYDRWLGPLKQALGASLVNG